MELINLLIVFAIIIVLLAMRKPLNIVMGIASVAVLLLYRPGFDAVLPALKEALLGKTTINSLLVLYAITFLQRMMEDRKQLWGCQQAMNGIFNNRRINVSVVPFLLGCLPAASTVILCGPIVRESIGDHLPTEEKAAVTCFARHISEAFLPTYTGIFIAISLTEGRITPASFVIGMLPIVAVLFAALYIVYLRRIPKDTGMTFDQPKSYYWKLLVKSIWCIVLTIAIILIFNLPVWLAVFICVGLEFFAEKFTFQEVKPFIRTAFEGKLMLNTIMVMIFGKLLAATGVIDLLPGYFAKLPIPDYLVYALLFFFGTLVAGSNAIYVMCIPMIVASVGSGPLLPLFILVMTMSYIVMQVTPTHICLTLCAEDYKIPLFHLITKVAPMVAVATVLSFGYYFVLSAVMR